MVNVLWKGIFSLSVILLVLSTSSYVSSESAENTLKAEYDFNNYKIITPWKLLKLKCIVNTTGFTFLWKNGETVLESGNGIEIANEYEGSQGSTTLTIEKATDSNAGDYMCIARRNNSDAELRATITVLSTPTTHLDADLIVVEGEKLILDCRPTGVPPPKIVWSIDNKTYNGTPDRIKLLPNKNNVSNAILQIDEVQMEDRGTYECTATNEATKTNIPKSVSKVRVKDKLAALWPFLGICAEVFVLCFIIFVYEKKRNKAELDESDTDNSPEQKNTPDHGKDSVRQRK